MQLEIDNKGNPDYEQAKTELGGFDTIFKKVSDKDDQALLNRPDNGWTKLLEIMKKHRGE